MREVVQSLEESRIREVANEGLGRSDVLRFWFGESDEVTPDFIREAAIASLQKGETFYAHNLGLVELRAAIAGYVLRQWQVDCSADARLRGPECRLWLAEPQQLAGVDNAVLAPGYAMRA